MFLLQRRNCVPNLIYCVITFNHLHKNQIRKSLFLPFNQELNFPTIYSTKLKKLQAMRCHELIEELLKTVSKEIYAHYDYPYPHFVNSDEDFNKNFKKWLHNKLKEAHNFDLETPDILYSYILPAIEEKLKLLSEFLIS